MRTLIIIPTYNERSCLGSVLDRIFRLPLKAGAGLDVLVVDDSSPDGTASLVQEKQRFEPRLFLLSRPEKRGLASAYIDGFRWGLLRGYDALVEMDADGSHDPSYLPGLISGLDAYDLIIGSRYVQGGGIENWSWWRRALSAGGNIYARLCLGASIRDLTGGLVAWRSAALAGMRLEEIVSDGYSFQVELKYRALRAGHSFKEVPIIFQERKEGRSKMSSAIVCEALWRLPWIRFAWATSKKAP